MLGQIEPAVQGGQKRGRLAREQREPIVVEVKMQKVELFIVAFLSYALQHHYMQRVGIADRSVEAQGFRPCRVELRRGLRITTGEQRDVVSQRYQFLGQPVYHPLGSAIKLGGNSLRQRGNLRDAHLSVSCCRRGEQEAPSRSWHRHAAEGTFPHVRSSPKDAHFFHTMVLLMPLRPIRLLPLLMLQHCCAVMAARWQWRRSILPSIEWNVSG